MIPKVLCRECSTELIAGAKFCSSCGAHIEWDKLNVTPLIVEQPTIIPSQERITRCMLCGYENAIENAYCESCGNLLDKVSSKKHVQPHHHKNVSKQPAPQLFKAVQSWKLTLGMAVLFIAVLFVIQASKNNESPAPSVSQQTVNSSVLSEIQSLERIVENSPGDKAALLRLANFLQDVRLHGQAIERYKQYLQLDPENTDVRVDLGVTYFNFALSDSTHYLQFLNRAKKELETAVKVSPSHQPGLYNLGIVNLHLGEMEQAAEWFKRCIAVDSTTEAGKKALNLINKHLFNNPS